MIIDGNYIYFTTTKIEEALALCNLKGSRLSKARHFINLLIQKQSKAGESNEEFWCNLPKLYLAKIYSKSYFRWLKELKKSSIIQTKTSTQGQESYSNYLHCGKAYRINPIYRGDDSGGDIICVQDKNGNAFPKVRVRESSHIITEYQRNYIAGCIKSLYYNFNLLYQIAEEKATLFLKPLLPEELPEHLQVKFYDTSGKKRRVAVSAKPYCMKKETVLSKLKDGDSIFLYKNEYYIGDLQKFIENKCKARLSSYRTSILNLKIGNVDPDRNLTNERIDSNITNMSKHLLDEISRANDLVQIDACNSQFAFLAHKLKQEGICGNDVDTFCQYAIEGKLYDRLIPVFGVKIRSEVKQMMFELFFSNEKSFLSSKEVIKRNFPTVYDYIMKYKKENGYKKFPVMLQKMESSIFVDSIYFDLISRNVFALTKHDSILCKRADVNTVLDVMKAKFAEIGFECTLKVDDKEIIDVRNQECRAA